MIALPLLLAGAVLGGDAPESYETLVARGLARGKEGQLAEARRSFDEAIALDPARPEAWVERGGLSFLEKEYVAAARDLREALDRRDDEYTRDLLASSLQLAGRGDEALAVWNPLGRPRLGTLDITGLVHTHDPLVRREIGIAEGDVVSLARVREARLRLAELGIFDRITVRPVPLGDGRADLDVALIERYGLYRTPLDLGLNVGTNLLFKRLRPRFANVAGSGLTVGGQYRWEEHRPDLSVFMDWPRPLGLDATFHVGGFRGEQLYLAGDPLNKKAHGLDLSARHVFAGRFVGQIAFRTRDRTFSRPDPSAPPGRIVGFEAGLDRRFLETSRQRLDASARFFASGRPLGSDVSFERGMIGASYKVTLGKPEGALLEKSLLATQVHWGRGSDAMPIDEMFAPGGSPEMELPLRAHPQDDDGALGATPIGRSLTLVNVEWRRRVVRTPFVQAGFVTFCDIGWVRRTASQSDLDHSFQDLGLGIRIGLGGTSVVRLDYAHGLSDGANAVFFGLNQVF